MAIKIGIRRREDVVGATMSEIVLFLLFSCLILLGNVLGVFAGSGDNGDPPPVVVSAEDLEDLRRQLDLEKQNNVALQGQIVILQTTIAEGDQELGELNDQLRLLREQLASVENALAEAQELILVLQGDNEALTAALNSAQDLANSLQGENKDLQAANDGLAAALRDRNLEAQQMQIVIGRLQNDVRSLEAENRRLRRVIERSGKQRVREDRPVSVVMPDSGGYRFVLGSDDMSEQFRETLAMEGMPKILNLIETMDDTETERDIILEVIGHTDELPVSSRTVSNLDKLPESYASGNLSFVDNVGLGMARAISVVRHLESLRESTPKLREVWIVPLSAGQMIDLNGRRAKGVPNVDDPSRRRIEIRVREHNQ